jgi:hypothetical protein
MCQGKKCFMQLLHSRSYRRTTNTIWIDTNARHSRVKSKEDVNRAFKNFKRKVNPYIYNFWSAFSALGSKYCFHFVTPFKFNFPDTTTSCHLNSFHMLQCFSLLNEATTVHRPRVDPRKECESCGNARFCDRK